MHDNSYIIGMERYLLQGALLTLQRMHDNRYVVGVENSVSQWLHCRC